jgi:hypothetical protein
MNAWENFQKYYGSGGDKEIRELLFERPEWQVVGRLSSPRLWVTTLVLRRPFIGVVRMTEPWEWRLQEILVNALLLSEGRILLAFNDSKQARANLRLAISYDSGANWRRIAEIENTPGQEFSYPYMIRSLDGRIHLVYTWRRKRIKHVVFNENWINAQIEKASK